MFEDVESLCGEMLSWINLRQIGARQIFECAIAKACFVLLLAFLVEDGLSIPRENFYVGFWTCVMEQNVWNTLRVVEFVLNSSLRSAWSCYVEIIELIPD